MCKIPRGKVEIYYYCTVNQPATDAAAAAAGPTSRMSLLNQEGLCASL